MSGEQFSAEYLPLRDSLYRVAYYILEDSEHASDMVQDLYLRLWDRRDALVSVRNPRAYCITLLRNMCIDHIRRSSQKGLDLSKAEDKASEGGSDSRMETAEELERVKKAIQALSPRERMVLEMKVFQQLSYEEIQRETSLGALLLRVTLSNARRKIRKAIQQ